MNRELLTSNELDEACFHLLASSTVKRYAKEARRLFTRTALFQRISFDENFVDETIGRSWELWRRVKRSTERTPAEFELALLLNAFEQIASDEVDRLLNGIAISTAPSTVWLSAVARRILAEKRSDLVLDFGRREKEPVSVANRALTPPLSVGSTQRDLMNDEATDPEPIIPARPAA